ncbi:MAG: hypothetical protein JNK49_09160 [Planctomycetes bacterium]|nr:hypothetical protein [Planctomycetota bacterium]
MPSARLRSQILLFALPVLPACGTTTYRLPIQVEPPTAHVYINGKKVGQGDRFVHQVDFSQAERVCIQAAAKGYEPRMVVLTRDELKAQIDSVGDIRWTLIQERQ